MKERPIIFNTENVKAILAGDKTQTRRVLALQLEITIFGMTTFYRYKGYWNTRRDLELECPFGQIGDRLWVRETWAVEYVYDNHKPADIPQKARVYYKTQDLRGIAFVGKWRPSIFMPRWASRILLEITRLRPERLQEITEEDAKSEGVDPEYRWANEPTELVPIYRWKFQRLWDSLNAKRGYGWDTNPWVWPIGFKVVK